MIAISVDNEAGSFLPVIEEVREASHAYNWGNLPAFSLSKNKTFAFNQTDLYRVLNSESGLGVVDVYANRISYFLNEFSRENQVVNRKEVSEILYGNKILLGMTERLIAEVSEKYFDKIGSISIWPMNDQESSKNYIFVTFRVIESVSVREAIGIEGAVKKDKWFSAFQAGLTFSFV
jgi:hypothetical protein